MLFFFLVIIPFYDFYLLSFYYFDWNKAWCCCFFFFFFGKLFIASLSSHTPCCMHDVSGLLRLSACSGLPAHVLGSLGQHWRRRQWVFLKCWGRAEVTWQPSVPILAVANGQKAVCASWPGTALWKEYGPKRSPQLLGGAEAGFDPSPTAANNSHWCFSMLQKQPGFLSVVWTGDWVENSPSQGL